MVLPLLPQSAAPKPASTLNPVFEIEGVPHVLVTQFMAAVPCSMLKVPVFSVEDRAHEVVAAMDCLFQGI